MSAAVHEMQMHIATQYRRSALSHDMYFLDVLCTAVL